MAQNKLSVARVRAITEPGRYGDGGGLYLMVSALKSGGVSRRWVFRYSIQGRVRDAGLGGADDVSLDAARKKAVDLRALVASGRDPLDEKARQAFEPVGGDRTFLSVASAYIEQKSAGWRSARHVNQWRHSVTVHCQPLHKLNVADIKTAHVVGVLNPIWQETPNMARRVRCHIETVIDYGRAMGMISHDAANPARWKGQIDVVMATQRQKRENHPSLPYAALPDFMVSLNTVESIPARALEFCILAAVRSGEARGALWSDIDWENRVWRISADRMKSGRSHEVPLSKEAMALLEDMARVKHCPLIFPSIKDKKMMLDAPLTAVLRRLPNTVDEKGRDVTVHGFRATFRTWVMEATQHDRAVAEMSLAHVVGDSTERAYARGVMLEKRRELMADWGEFAMSALRKPSKLRLVS